MSIGDQPFPKQRGLGAGWPLLIEDNQQKAMRFKFPRLPCIEGSLETGDYTVRGLADRVGWEIKQACGDLIGCVPGDNVPPGEIQHDAVTGKRILSERARFERELQRAADFDFFAVYIVGTVQSIQNGDFSKYSNMNPSSVFGSIKRWRTKYRTEFRFFATMEACAEQIENDAIFIVDEYRQLLAGIEMRAPEAEPPK